jgi:hypothetical protein
MQPSRNPSARNGHSIVGQEIDAGRPFSEGAEHSKNLAAMERGVVHHMHENLPSRKLNVASVPLAKAEFASEIGF